MAKQRGFLTLKGTGYRKERKGSPLINTFRQFCDAKGACFVRLEKGTDVDSVVVDFSTLRVPDDSAMVNLVKQVANGANIEEEEEIILRELGPEDMEDLRKSAIWGIQERELRFFCEREEAKVLAMALVERLAIPKEDLSIKKRSNKMKGSRKPRLPRDDDWHVDY